MKMTEELLRELGSCGDYTRTFRRQFPTDRYPDGVEVNEEVCGQQSQNFPWSWAVEVMLNAEGSREWQRVYDELESEYNQLIRQHQEDVNGWRERTGVHNRSDASEAEQEALDRIGAEHRARVEEAGFNTAYNVYNHMQARAFGRVFDQHPEYRSPKIPAAQERAIARAERAIIDQYTGVERELEYARRQIENLTQEIERLQTQTLPRLEEREAELRVQVAPAKARRAQAEAKLLAERAEEAVKRAQEAQEAAVKAQADADALTAEAASVTKTDEDGSASTEVAAEATS